MRIATWNIGGGFTSNGNNKFTKKDMNYFLTELKNIKTDIILLQEVHCNQDNTLSEQLNLSKKNYLSSNIHKSHIEKNMNTRLSTLTNFEVLSKETIFLPNPNLIKKKKNIQLVSHDKAFLKTEIKYGKIKINIFNIQLLPLQIFDRNYSEEQFSNIRTEIENIILKEDKPTIICGDFNYDNLQKIIPKVFSNGFKDVFQNIPTEVYKNIQKDHILISKEWNIKSFKVIKGK
ncbi:endonuclease/exonuclease/phosphatase family protein, partial [Candidatus Woesearchaeota archaeon]|nr:endonuclease/exonuclease/phosphatase family protein [Candidatus Woesearchaeota archaeon]